MAESAPPSRRRTNGPVVDLESHLPGDWWRALCNALCLKTDGDVLEVNPNLGWCWDGKMNLMAELAGWSYVDMLSRILQAGKERVRAELDRGGRKVTSDRAA